ncbi:MAG: phosphotransferase [Cypionkella sp.]|nr:phosphotransferase [Cypionkella sp.]
MSDRKALSTSFLIAEGWGTALRRFLAGDASDRSYDRLTRGAQTAVLMDAPPGKGDDPATFIAIADHLRGIGLSAPQIYARDLQNGFLLIEDLGDDLFARVLRDAPTREPELYRLATDVLLHLQSHPAPQGLGDLSARDWAKAASFALDWYVYAATDHRPDAAGFIDTLGTLLSRYADGPRVMILRDYHAENLLVLAGREGVASVGILDFQLAQMGQPGYDLVSLLQDARRDVAPAVEAEMIRRFADSKALDLATFQTAYAVLGAQRALRILGIFARLCLVSGKPGYLTLVPRVWGQLQANLSHPALHDLRRLCDALLPEPTPQILQTIGKKCVTPSP